MKTGKGLAQYAIAQLGRPYWWGTFGQTATSGLLAAKRRQYPGYYQDNDFETQVGQKVHDCVGLIKGYLWCDGPDGWPIYKGYQDVAVGGLYNNCSRKGSLSTIPEIPGVCVFQDDMGHVGVYIGNGKVVEAMGHRYGVVMTDLHNRNWSLWGMPDWINYDGSSAVDIPQYSPQAKPQNVTPTYFYKVELPLLKQGMVCPAVKSAQRLLISKDFDCGAAGADGEMGNDTVEAVKRFQRACNLLADGEIGGDTWAALLKT